MTGESLRDVMARLEAMGTAQNRKVYSRHGVTGDLFGVSYADLGRLRREIKIDHRLAQQLWDTKNHDARVLATMVADPDATSRSLLNSWARDLDNYVLTGALAGLVAKTPHAYDKMRQWTRARGEWTGRAGWLLLATLAEDPSAVGDDELVGYLEVIERGIHRAKNRVRDAMNSALIAIGARSDGLEQRALAVAARIGVVDVDHGKTSCKTPAATSSIPKARERQRRRLAEAGAGAR